MDNRQLNFSHLLYLTAHHWRLAVNRRLKNLGLSQASWVAVAAIARHHSRCRKANWRRSWAWRARPLCR
jgi:hypothetical protein